MSRSGSSAEFPTPEAVTCDYYEDCFNGALYAVNTAINPETEANEVVACRECAEEFVGGYGNSWAQVRELDPVERWEVDDAA